MTRRINQLEKLSWEFDVSKMRPQFNPEKFAGLIIQDCITICQGNTDSAQKTLETFVLTGEVHPSLVARGAYEQAKHITETMKKHFGIHHETRS